jgi:hypothetical protein
MYINTKELFFVRKSKLIIVCGIITSALCLKAATTNIAVNKSYKLSPAPNYPLCKDDGDIKQLTDGKATVESKKNGALWTYKSAVGWRSGKKQIQITIDLGKIQPVSGAAFFTAGNSFGGGVPYPRSIRMYVSPDDNKYYFVGDLAEKSYQQLSLPDTKQPFRVKFSLDRLKTKARYVKFAVSSGEFLFCDEIEIFKGDNEFLQTPYEGQPAKSFMPPEEWFVNLGCRKRFWNDLSCIKKLVKSSRISHSEKGKLLNIAQRIEGQINSFEFKGDIDTFRGILPYNKLHKDIFAIYGKLLELQGYKALTIWHTYRYDFLKPIAKPVKESQVSLEVTMMRNAFRATAINLTNASDKAMIAGIKLVDLPAGIIPRRVEFTGTPENLPIARVLSEISQENGIYKINIPAGMTSQIWFNVCSKGIKAQTYKGKLVLYSSTKDEVPFTVNVAPFVMPETPTMHNSNWDYASDLRYGITKENQKAVFADLKSHYSSVWAAGGTLPIPPRSCFDVSGKMTGKPDFSKLAFWVKNNPDFRRYFVFEYILNHSKFAGFSRGTPAFEQALSSWSKALEVEAKKLGLKKGQLVLHFLDEPRTPENHEVSRDWMKAFKMGTSYVYTFLDPIQLNEKNFKPANESLRYTDIICPTLGEFNRAPKNWKRLFYKLRDSGKEFHFYMCSGSSPQFDPDYYRLMSWFCFKEGANGSLFWNYSEPDTWKPYINKLTYYNLVMLNKTTITSTKHWEAVREGIEDYEYLVLLRKRIAELKKSGTPESKYTEAEKTLQNSVKEITDSCLKRSIYYTVSWYQNKGFCKKMDDARLRVLAALMDLR